MSFTVMLLTGCLLFPLLALGVVALLLGPSAIKGYWSMFQMMRAGIDGSNPSRITLEPATADVWRNKSQVQNICRELQAAGFAPAGVFTVREIPPLAIAGLYDQNRRTYAAVYDMAVVGVWVDFACLHEDETGLTVTNAKIGWGIDTQPDREKLGRSGASLPELLAILDGHAHAHQRVAKSAEEFAAVFESEYAREQDWRLARGGPTPEEIERTAREAGMTASEKDIEEVVRSTAQQNLPEIARACIANYLSQAPMDTDERKALEPKLVAVHDRLTNDESMELFATLAGEAARELDTHPAYLAMEEEWEALTPREIFSRLANAMPNPAFPRFQGRVSIPVEADVYRVSEDLEGH